MAYGKFITIEGIEGAGKSTALTFIQGYLEEKQLPTLFTREPGGTAVAELIRQILLHPPEDETVHPLAELLLLFAGRIQHVVNLIKPALQKGLWVVSDRFIDASYAYQGGGRGLPTEFISLLEQYTLRDTKPDLTLLLDIEPTLGMARAKQRNQHLDRIEKEQLDFFAHTRAAYLSRAKFEPKRIQLIDASQNISSVETQIRNALTQFIAEQI